MILKNKTTPQILLTLFLITLMLLFTACGAEEEPAEVPPAEALDAKELVEEEALEAEVEVVEATPEIAAEEMLGATPLVSEEDVEEADEPLEEEVDIPEGTPEIAAEEMLEATPLVEEEDVEEANQPLEAEALGVPALRATTMLDYPVINPGGEGIGEVRDLMIGLDTGRVRYAVLSFAGFLGTENDLYAIPLELLSIDPESGALQVRMDLGRLEDAPVFQEEDWVDEKLFAIPVSALLVDHADNAVIFDVDEATLEAAPGFDPGKLARYGQSPLGYRSPRLLANSIKITSTGPKDRP